MQTFFTLEPEQQNTAVALGFFDGVHRGHRRVLGATAQARESGLLPVCLTFSESPKSVIRGTELPMLMTAADKLRALEEIGIEHVFFADFRSLMHLDARDFFKDVLVDTLRAKALFCGFNYRFGKHAAGEIKMLRALCDEFGLTLKVAPPELDQGEVVCSTLIKQLVSDGNVRRANALMGSRFGIAGEIRHGRQLGQRLGTPTINQLPDEGLISPKYGVYVSAVTLESGERFCGVTNVGVKPTVGGTTLLWETWMPRYHGGELYGRTADVRLIDFIREERKFESLEALKEEIQKNAQTALKIYDGIK